MTVLQEAVEMENIELAQSLLRVGADVNAHPTLLTAVRKGNIELARILLDAGADANASKFEVGTALQVAARSGSIARSNSTRR